MAALQSALRMSAISLRSKLFSAGQQVRNPLLRIVSNNPVENSVKYNLPLEIKLLFCLYIINIIDSLLSV